MGAKFTTVQNDGGKCMRLLVADNEQMKGAAIYDVGAKNPTSVNCADGVQKVRANITPGSWLVLSERFDGDDYYASAPFRIDVPKSTILSITMSPASKAKWPTYHLHHVVYADVVHHTLTLGATAPSAGFKGVAVTVPPPHGFKAGAWNPAIYMYIGVGAAVIVVIVLVVVLSVVLTRRRAAKLQ